MDFMVTDNYNYIYNLIDMWNLFKKNKETKEEKKLTYS